MARTGQSEKGIWDRMVRTGELRTTARYIYKAKNGKLLVVLTPSQKTKLIFEQYKQTLFNKDLF
jgi:hypothetical protein